MKKRSPTWYVTIAPAKTSAGPLGIGEVVVYRYKYGRPSWSHSTPFGGHLPVHLETGLQVLVGPENVKQCKTKYEALQLAKRYKRGEILS